MQLSPGSAKKKTQQAMGIFDRSSVGASGTLLKGVGCELSQAELQKLCRSVLQVYSPIFREKEIEAFFYPYIGLTHTIRCKGNRWVVRISDHCRNAPQPVLEAVITMLACKVLRQKPRWAASKIYETFRADPTVGEAVRSRRLLRGRKAIDGNEGKCYSLGEIYRELNGRYFNNQIEIQAIGWGLRPGRGRLGHYDPVHNSIVVSPILDSPEVPKYVLSYIVYHEMLHALFETSSARGLKRHHPPEFHRAERAYPDYAQAKRFLKEFCRRSTARKCST